MIHLTGVRARIEYGYMVAAVVADYTLSGNRDDLTVTGRLVDPHGFRLQQRPLRFVAPHARGAWTWPIDTLTITATRITARLGARE